MLATATVSRSAEVVTEYGYRYYNAELGRWLSSDPLGEAGGVNLYGFVGNNGIDRADVLGAIEWRGLLDITLSGEILRATERGLRQGRSNLYNAAAGVVMAPSNFGAAMGKEIGDYAYLPDEFDARWVERRAMLEALLGDPCYRQLALEALKKELGESIANGSLFSNLSADVLTSLAGIGVVKQLDRLNELMKWGRLPKPGVAAKTPKPTWPSTAQQMDDFLKVPGKRIPDTPNVPGRGKVEWRPNPDTKITFEQHPYHPSAPDWHKGPHFHLDTTGIKPHQRYVPGDPIPGY